ncbi:MAG TPA: glycosyltransferase family 39 protein [Gaiellaceae bacterium]|nr:glycosyltransferase family 39 protein [Gaiellaceae bacterium]
MTVPNSASQTATPARDISPREFAVGVAACVVGVGAFLLLRLHAWPPHEDETLALFVGRSSFGGLLHTVLGVRGGAPLHYVLAWAIAHTGGGLTGLRLVSAFFAVASLPTLAALSARLTDRATALVATVLASGSWVLLFHGIYGRMYSAFLFTSALSYLALLRALERGGRRAWALWVLAALVVCATHPYGVLVVASQALYVLIRRQRLREAAWAFAAVVVLGIPFWRASLVLADRFDIGVGGGGPLRGPVGVLRYLRATAGDFSAGWTVTLWAALALAAAGLFLLARRRPVSALLVACALGTPALALVLAHLGSSTSPQTRHLIFALPFFSTLVAVPFVAVARSRRGLLPVAAVALAALFATEIGWAWHKTPLLFKGEPGPRVAARHAASDWLARSGRGTDVLFGYDPLYLGAWQRGGTVTRTIVPRADPTLALAALQTKQQPLGRGVWVLDASDTNNAVRRSTIPLRRPSPASTFEARVFGPFLVIRSRAPTGTPLRFLEETRAVMELGRTLHLGSADVNLHTALVALGQLGYAPPRSSRSTSSR